MTPLSWESAVLLLVAAVCGAGLVRLWRLQRSQARMSVEIDRLRERLEKLDLDLQRDLTLALPAPAALTPLVEAIESALRRLQFKALRERKGATDKILGSVAHDFRGPLASIRGYSETLRERLGQLTSAEREDCFEAIERSVAALERIVTSSLALSKLEARAVKVSRKPFRAADLICALEERFAPYAAERGLTFEAAVSSENLLALGDYAMIERVLVNLIENAIAHSASGKEVRVEALDGGAAVQFRVADQGCGIAAEHLPHIFEEFYRAERDRSRLSGGAGLGLSLVKKIIEEHGSTVKVESEIGRGSTFSFELRKPADAQGYGSLPAR